MTQLLLINYKSTEVNAENDCRCSLYATTHIIIIKKKTTTALYLLYYISQLLDFHWSVIKQWFFLGHWIIKRKKKITMFSSNFDAISYILYLRHWTLDVCCKNKIKLRRKGHNRPKITVINTKHFNNLFINKLVFKYNLLWSFYVQRYANFLNILNLFILLCLTVFICTFWSFFL